jgi:hypothetical protein
LPRPRQRGCLQDGLHLSLSALAREGIIRFGSGYTSVRIGWLNNYTGEEIASAWIATEMSDVGQGWLRVQLGQLDQWITLMSLPRHFGGRQWYFLCPFMNRRASVLWKPPGANEFSCRQRWGRQVAYASQFRDRISRAHDGKAKINYRLCRIGGFDPDEWDIPPKPKWMRWHTYNQAVEKFDRYEALLNQGLLRTAARLMGRF